MTSVFNLQLKTVFWKPARKHTYFLLPVIILVFKARSDYAAIDDRIALRKF